MTNIMILLLKLENDPYVKIFRAHMVILNCRSPYLRRILSTNKKKNDETLIHIKLPNILPEIFQIILRYIFSTFCIMFNFEKNKQMKIYL